jgi:predicted ester cyclase
VTQVSTRKRRPLDRLLGRQPAERPQSDDSDAPFPGYNRIDEKELVNQLHKHSQAELEQIEAYERSHGSRTRVLNKLHYLRQREPLPNYDALSSEEVGAALEQADLATIDDVRAYERKFANRPNVLEKVAEVRHRVAEEESQHDTRSYRATSYGPSAAKTSSRAPGPGQLAANKGLIAGFYAEVINARDLDALDRLLSDEFVHNGHARARSEQRRTVAELLEAFPDLETETELILAEGDLVSAHQRWSGTHQGAVAGLEPTRRRVDFTSTAVFRIRDGQIAEAWDEIDLGIIVSRLGDDGE